MSNTQINTRIVLKNDTASNWNESTLIPLKGEVCIEIDTNKIKIGDGVNVYSKLKYANMTPEEITALVGDGAVQSVSLASGTNNGTLKLTVDGTATDNIAVKGLGSMAYQNTNAWVSGIKGNSETSYRQGNVNITKSNIGLGNVDNTTDANKNVLSATKLNSNRTIALTGDVTGSVSSDLSGNVSITTTVGNDSHSHSNSSITSLDASKITSGVIDIARIPQAALERLVKVADDTARFALTVNDIQLGDSVLVTGTGKMYIVIDTSKLSDEAGYQVYKAGSAAEVPWSGVTGKPSTFAPSSHTHPSSQISDATSSNTANMIVKRDSSGNFSASTITGNLTGLASQATSDAKSQNIASTYIKKLDVSGTTITYTRGDDTTGTLTTQDTNTNTDTLMTQTVSTTAAEYPVLLSSATTTGTRTGLFGTGITINPSTKAVTAATFNGALKGNATTATTATNCTGNAGTATTLKTARTIGTSGAVVGTATSFNGSENITIATTSVNTDYLSNGSNTLVLNGGSSV